MGFDLPGLLEGRRGQGYELHARYLNPQLPRMLHAIGFDKVYERAEGAYLYDRDGNKYADFLAGFGVFGVGRNHPVVREALHSMLDAELADMVQFDCSLLPGLLAEQLLAKADGLDRVYFCNSGTEAVEAALKFARYATGRSRVLYCDHAFHGLTVGSLSVNGSAEFRRGFDPLLPDGCVPFGDLDALERELRAGDVAGLIVEPVQGKGAHVAPQGYLAARGQAAARPRRAADLRRGADRHRPDRAVLRLPARRRRAGHRHRGQGTVRRVRPGRRDAGEELDLREGLLLDGPGAGARLDVRLQRRGHGRRAWPRCRSSRTSSWSPTPSRPASCSGTRSRTWSRSTSCSPRCAAVA